MKIFRYLKKTQNFCLEQVLFSACVVSKPPFTSLALILGDYRNRKRERSSENKTRREEARLYPEK